MSKLVLIYTISDVCTYSCEVVQPFEYESTEAAICDFDEALQEAFNNKNHSFKFCGHVFDVSDFYRYNDFCKKPTYEKFLPEISTLDCWFEQNKILNV